MKCYALLDASVLLKGEPISFVPAQRSQKPTATAVPDFTVPATTPLQPRPTPAIQSLRLHMRHAPLILHARLLLIERVLLADAALHGGPLRDALDPREQVRELVHLVLRRHLAELPALDPRPGAHVRDGVLALPVAGEVLARLARVVPAQVQLQDAVDALGFFAEAVDGVVDFLGGGAVEVIELALAGEGWG